MPDPPQTTQVVLMIRPARFRVNPETAGSNSFQSTGHANAAEAARAEFDDLVSRLEAHGVTTLVFNDTEYPAKPDAVFPNNWVSFHSDGRTILYPMRALNRRAERRRDVLEALAGLGWSIRRTVDLSVLEEDGLALEGTGSLVLDRPGRLAYAAVSARTDDAALDEFVGRTGYRVHRFHTLHRGLPVYHTNVMLALGRHFAVICDEVVKPVSARSALLDQLAASGRALVRINADQMARFAANLLELDTPSGPVIAMSASAHDALSPSQLGQLAEHGALLSVPLPVIESGGGSLRCMLAEVFLPRKGRVGG